MTTPQQPQGKRRSNAVTIQRLGINEEQRHPRPGDLLAFSSANLPFAATNNSGPTMNRQG